MAIPHNIFCKYALIGDDLILKQNVKVTIEQGRISNIKSNSSHSEAPGEYSFPHHLLLPKFINSHTHLGDSILKNQAFGLSLNEAVGIQGHKYQIQQYPRVSRVAAMRSAIIEMIESGTAVCFDFRENGLKGIKVLREAVENLPIDLHILGRQDLEANLTTLLSQCDGLGLATPLLYSQKEMEAIRNQTSSPHVLVATHIGEEISVIKESLKRFGLSDLQVSLNHLNPDILIHLTKLKENELQEIPTSKFIVFCPRSNAYYGLGFPPIDYFLNKAHLIGLGTDNVMSNSPNILEELRWLILRLKEQNIPFNPSNALKFITINPSKALKLSTGCIKENYWADLLVVNLQSTRTAFGNDPILNLLFRCQFPEDISLNLFHGEVISNELA
ncbi:MAG: amidohydrolase family protein [Candidatus Heimdallarchaeota archaeon]|nr:MAG: amidohydrolase family protein [Candidatus Heimdallarchaeota archaeon]